MGALTEAAAQGAGAQVLVTAAATVVAVREAAQTVADETAAVEMAQVVKETAVEGARAPVKVALLEGMTAAAAGAAATQHRWRRRTERPPRGC